MLVSSRCLTALTNLNRVGLASGRRSIFKQMRPDFRAGSVNLLPLASLRLLTGLAMVTHGRTPGVPVSVTLFVRASDRYTFSDTSDRTLHSDRLSLGNRTLR